MFDGYISHYYTYMEKVVKNVEPICFEDAIENVHWDNAMDKEMVALDVNETWDLVQIPEGKMAIGC